MASPAYNMHDQMKWLTWLAERYLIHNSNDCHVRTVKDQWLWFIALNLLRVTHGDAALVTPEQMCGLGLFSPVVS